MNYFWNSESFFDQEYVMSLFDFVYISDSSSGERNTVSQICLVWERSYTWLISCVRVHLHNVCMSRWSLSQRECVLLNIIFFFFKWFFEWFWCNFASWYRITQGWTWKLKISFVVLFQVEPVVWRVSQTILL